MRAVELGLDWGAVLVEFAVVLLNEIFLIWGPPVELWLVIGKMLRGHKHNVVIVTILQLLQIITIL